MGREALVVEVERIVMGALEKVVMGALEKVVLEVETTVMTEE